MDSLSLLAMRSAGTMIVTTLVAICCLQLIAMYNTLHEVHAAAHSGACRMFSFRFCIDLTT